MARRNPELEIGCQIALCALVVAACIAGIPPIVDTVARSLAQSKVDAERAALSCGTCGVVVDVREVTLGATKQEVSTVSGGGLEMFLGLLSGKLGTGRVKIHEVTVRLQDGSVRVFREAARSAWKPGDRVKTVMGRIEPVS